MLANKMGENVLAVFKNFSDQLSLGEVEHGSEHDVIHAWKHVSGDVT